MKAIYCPNLQGILKDLQSEFPWCDDGVENVRTIFAWGQDRGLETLDKDIVRSAIYLLGRSALETTKEPAAPVVPQPAPAPPKPARFDWYSIGDGEIPLEGPDGSEPPVDFLQGCGAAQLKSLVRRQEKARKPWLTDFTDRGSQFRG